MDIIRRSIVNGTIRALKAVTRDRDISPWIRYSILALLLVGKTIYLACILIAIVAGFVLLWRESPWAGIAYALALGLCLFGIYRYRTTKGKGKYDKKRKYWDL